MTSFSIVQEVADEKCRLLSRGMPGLRVRRTAVRSAALDPVRHQVEVVHLGEQENRIAEADAVGVKSVPALVIGGAPFHINYGAALADLK